MIKTEPDWLTRSLLWGLIGHEMPHHSLPQYLSLGLSVVSLIFYAIKCKI